MARSRVRAILPFLLAAVACQESVTAPPPAAPPAGAPSSPSVVTGPADYAITCARTNFDVREEPLAGECTITPSNGFRGTVRLSCAGHPYGVACAFLPAEVTIAGAGAVTSGMHVSRTIEAEPGTHAVRAVAEGGGLSHSADVRIAVPEVCAGYWQQASHSGPCNPAAQQVCLEYSDGFIWRTRAVMIMGWSTSTCFGKTVESTEGFLPLHKHVLGTNLVKRGD